MLRWRADPTLSLSADLIVDFLAAIYLSDVEHPITSEYTNGQAPKRVMTDIVRQLRITENCHRDVPHLDMVDKGVLSAVAGKRR
jgi:hypothetical protein